ncbi:MAG: hypothetical protein IJL35_09195 [Bacteroidaceae bacterium]|nr:hypothetical protein [Bacteroidaceae bacterium]
MKKLFLFILTCCLGQTGVIKATNTDVSDISNVVYIQPFEVEQGVTNYAMSINMKNSADIRGFQFNLELPEGITPVEEGDVILCGLNPDRSPKNSLGTLYHTIEAKRQEDGSYVVLCGSQQDKTFLGNDGEIAVLYVNVAQEVPTGDYPIILRNIKLTETDINHYYTTELVESTVTVTEPGGFIKFDENSNRLPTYTPGDNGNVKMTRTITAGMWSTLVLPFNLTRANANAVFGEGKYEMAKFAGFKVDYGDDEENLIPLGIEILFEQYTIPPRGGKLDGGTPILIKTENDIDKIELEKVTLTNVVNPVSQEDSGSEEPTYTTGKFTGSLVKTKVPADGLFISDNQFWYSTGDTNIKAFRGWFELGAVLDKETNFSVKMNILVDGESTQVDGLLPETSNDAIYDLTGRKVEKAEKGIYIVNGKKVLK